PARYHAESGSGSGRYDNIGADLPTTGELPEITPVRVQMQLTDLPLLTTVHWRVVASNGRGTHFGVDETTFWAKFYDVEPVYCLKHLQWPAVTADIIGDGCWKAYIPKPWDQVEKSSIPPPPAPYGNTSVCLVIITNCPPP